MTDQLPPNYNVTFPNLAPASAREVAECLSDLLGSYRKFEAENPKRFMDTLLEAMAAYPLDVLRAAVSASTGLPAKHKFPPNAAEVKEFCNAMMAPRWREAERIRRRTETREAELQEAQIRQGPRKTYEEIAADFAKVGFRFGPYKHVRTTPEEEAAEARERLIARGITPEQFEALENAKPGRTGQFQRTRGRAA